MDTKEEDATGGAGGSAAAGSGHGGPKGGPGDAMELDGSMLEGGGQILRNSVALAALTGKPIRITKIRAGRSKPGLKAQHMTGVDLVARMHGGDVDGCKLNSSELTFRPTDFDPGTTATFHADIGTAGSIALLIQCALPPLVFAPVAMRGELRGGTNVAHAPMVEYVDSVFRPMAERFGVHFSLDVKRRGFFPRGGGEVHIETSPVAGALKPLVVEERGALVSVKVWAFHAQRMPEQVATRLCAATVRGLSSELRKLDVEIGIEQAVEHLPGGNPAAGVMITCTTSTGNIFASTGLLERRDKPEGVGAVVAEEMGATLAHGGALDEYLTDQVIVFMALADGHSKIRTGPLSLHTQTSIHFSSLLTGAKFTVTPTEENAAGRENSFWIEADGVAFRK